MEGFELIAGPVIIVRRHWSGAHPQEVYSSLTIGVFTGMIIYQFTLNGAGGEQLVASFPPVPQMMAEQIAGNGALLCSLRSGSAYRGHRRRAAPAPAVGHHPCEDAPRGLDSPRRCSASSSSWTTTSTASPWAPSCAR